MGTTKTLKNITMPPAARGVTKNASKNRSNAHPKVTVSEFRTEILRLHRRIYRRNQERINQAVFGYTPAFQKYEHEYRKSTAKYLRRARLEELEKAISKADVVYVGDYHTLPQSQRSFLRLLRRLPPSRQVVIALEFVEGRHQKTIDSYIGGCCSDQDFLNKIEREPQWMTGSWPSFKPIFDLARERGWHLIGLDTTKSERGGNSLHSRDAYAARRIVQARKHHPDSLVMALAGELHVAPCHLPRAVEKELKKKEEVHKPLIVYQNCRDIYWKLEERGQEHETNLVRLDTNRFCITDTPPIVCQQSFLNWVEIDEDTSSLDAPEKNFKAYAKEIANSFDLPLDGALNDVEVHSVVDLSFLLSLQRRGDFSAGDVRQIKRQVLNSESYYIPRAKMAYLGNLSSNHAAEEATHFLRHLCSGADEPKLLVDAFYARCIEEAIGFMGSKIINHKRKCPRVPDLKRLARGRNSKDGQKEMARLALRHIRMEKGQKVRNLSEVYECDIDIFNGVTHILGYRLGERLFYALVDNMLAKSEVRELFFDHLEEEGEAILSYLYLIARTSEVALPERM